MSPEGGLQQKLIRHCILLRPVFPNVHDKTLKKDICEAPAGKEDHVKH